MPVGLHLIMMQTQVPRISTPLIQLSTPELVVSLFAFRRTQLFCVRSFVLLGYCGVYPNIHLSILEAS
ncbi:hypothetical protein MTR67_053018 [Solanum verrucosum]|uniref:Uncharacterized protein n=1 Tax=Solanum verrucosum TaxID=315347 RepID=A0AAF0V659_SOLVR|nr:hypothetical protein MTR67_053018 [Solanum verrucosum]